jgi:hypothetical protein
MFMELQMEFRGTLQRGGLRWKEHCSVVLAISGIDTHRDEAKDDKSIPSFYM